MASGDVVRLVNVGDSPFVDAYNGRGYTIDAHGQMMVDWDAMCLWLGHPDADNFDPKNRVRLMEYERIKTRCGVFARELQMSVDNVPFDPGELFDSLRPPLEAYDMAGERILTVADDPEGDFLAPKVAAGKTGDMNVMMARMQALEQEQANLRSQLAQAQRREQALSDAEPVDPDSPRPIPQNQGIPGTVTEAENPDAPASRAPRDPVVNEAGEDQPTRIRVTQP